jgi:hypothetical protein
MTIEIPVGKKHVALVDDADAEKVRGFRWYVAHSRHRRTVYARSDFRIEGGRIKLLMHRIILDLRPGEFADHADGNGLNNQRANLRRCTRSENMRNRRKTKQSARSPYKGVYAYNGSDKWIAIIKDPVTRKQTTIGVFDDPVAAAKAYDVEARKLFGEFAAPNFPELIHSPP